MNAKEKENVTELKEELQEAHNHEHELEEEIETCDNVIIDLETERDEWKDKSYRLAAEMENLKKRSLKEVEDARKYSISGIAKELVEVKDNLDRALEMMKKADGTSTEEVIKSMLEGIKMVEKQISSSCEKLKISKIESLGQKFDPELHQVMLEVEDEAQESGTIVQEMQAGYKIGDRLLRPALVATAK